MRPTRRSRLLYAPVALVVATLVLAGCFPQDGQTGGGGSSEGAGQCDYPEDSAGAAKEVEPPPADPEVSGQVSATIELGQGSVPVTLDARSAPCTVGSFVSLAEQGYFDSTSCHRVTSAAAGIQVLQCGDPTGTGTGGPGYTIPDELSGDETYPPGTLAMAKASEPDSGGSQFFLVYGETPLPADYTVFGEMDPEGLDVVQKIGQVGAAQGAPDGPPAMPVNISRVTID